MFYENLPSLGKILFVLSVSLFCVFLSFYSIAIVFFLILTLFPFVIYLLFKKTDRIALILIILIVFQNIIAIFLIGRTNNGTVMQAFILTKELLAYSALLVSFLFNFKKLKFRNTDLFALFFSLILFIYLIIPTELKFFVKLVQFRQIITPIILYFLGRVLLVNNIEKLLKFLVYISNLAVLFGFLERFILTDSFWTNMGIRKYLLSKGMEAYAFGFNGLPGNFYTFDYYSIIGKSLRRMVSFIADPTLFGQFLVLPIAILLFTQIFKGKQKKIYILFLTLGLLLTLSKGGIFSLIIAIIYKILKSKHKILGYLVLCIFIALTGIVLTNAHIFSSLPAHIEGLTHNFELMFEHPLGLGLGQSGNLSIIYSNNNNDIGSGESYIGVIIGQLGIFTILFLLFLVTLIKNIGDLGNENIKNLSIVLAGTLIGTIGASFISESAISFISAGVLFLMSGVFISSKHSTH